MAYIPDVLLMAAHGGAGKNEKKLAELRAAKMWQIADINFGKVDSTESDLLTKMDTEFREKMKKIKQLTDLEASENKEEKMEAINTLKEQILEHNKEFRDTKTKYVSSKKRSCTRSTRSQRRTESPRATRISCTPSSPLKQ